jgi:hypothetical protein
MEEQDEGGGAGQLSLFNVDKFDLYILKLNIETLPLLFTLGHQ